MKSILAIPALIAAAVLVAGTSAVASTFTIDPSSSLDLSGNVSMSFAFAGGATVSGSGNVAEQGLGSLHTTQSGFINADAAGTTLNFPGGSFIAANTTGNWDPQKVPAAFGFVLTIPLSAPALGIPDAGSARFFGDIRDVTFDVTGSVPLGGLPGSRTFDTSGLALITKSGTIDLHAFFCAPGQTDLSQCQDLGTRSSPADDGSPDILPHGDGTLTGTGFKQNLFAPISLAAPDSETDTRTVVVNGIPVQVTTTISGTFNIDGNVFASAIPEPSSWLAICLGLTGLAAGSVRLRRKSYA